MKLEKAFYEAAMHVKDGELRENGTHRLVPLASLESMIASVSAGLHDFYVSPSSTVRMNQEQRYLEALETIKQFMDIKPVMDKLGLTYSV